MMDDRGPGGRKRESPSEPPCRPTRIVEWPTKSIWVSMACVTGSIWANLISSSSSPSSLHRSGSSSASLNRHFPLWLRQTSSRPDLRRSTRAGSLRMWRVSRQGDQSLASCAIFSLIESRGSQHFLDQQRENDSSRGLAGKRETNILALDSQMTLIARFLGELGERPKRWRK